MPSSPPLQQGCAKSAVWDATALRPRKLNGGLRKVMRARGPEAVGDAQRSTPRVFSLQGGRCWSPGHGRPREIATDHHMNPIDPKRSSSPLSDGAVEAGLDSSACYGACRLPGGSACGSGCPRPCPTQSPKLARGRTCSSDTAVLYRTGTMYWFCGTDTWYRYPGTGTGTRCPGTGPYPVRYPGTRRTAMAAASDQRVPGR